MPKKLKKIPNFKNLKDEKKFWQNADTSEYFDYSKAELVEFPNLKPSTESISIRLPSSLLTRIKKIANSQDVPYQSLMKVYLADRVKEEISKDYDTK